MNYIRENDGAIVKTIGDTVMAVNTNEILDYFDRTVNLAARIQQESMGDDIVFSENLYQELLQQVEYGEITIIFTNRAIFKASAWFK